MYNDGKIDATTALKMMTDVSRDSKAATSTPPEPAGGDKKRTRSPSPSMKVLLDSDDEGKSDEGKTTEFPLDTFLIYQYI